MDTGTKVRKSERIAAGRSIWAVHMCSTELLVSKKRLLLAEVCKDQRSCTSCVRCRACEAEPSADALGLALLNARADAPAEARRRGAGGAFAAEKAPPPWRPAGGSPPPRYPALSTSVNTSEVPRDLPSTLVNPLTGHRDFTYTSILQVKY